MVREVDTGPLPYQFGI